MAQNDDFIGFLLGCVFKLFGWIFLGLIKLAGMLVTGIFKGISSLFHKA